MKVNVVGRYIYCKYIFLKYIYRITTIYNIKKGGTCANGSTNKNTILYVHTSVTYVF